MESSYSKYFWNIPNILELFMTYWNFSKYIWIIPNILSISKNIVHFQKYWKYSKNIGIIPNIPNILEMFQIN